MSDEPHLAPTVSARTGYAICTERRSGSTFLCQVLASTGMLGHPLDYFNPAGLRRQWPDYPREPAAQLARILAGATPNGVYGFKIFPQEFDYAQTSRWAARLPALQFIHLTRRDKLGQAISMLRAQQTDQWQATLGARAKPAYDRAALLAALHEVVLADARWESYFARTGIAPLQLVYEDVLTDVAGAVAAIGRQVGLTDPPIPDFERVATREQRDGLSQDWRARFVREAGDRDALDYLHAVPLRRWVAHHWPRLAQAGRRLLGR